MRPRSAPAQSWSTISSDDASIQWASSSAISSGPDGHRQGLDRGRNGAARVLDKGRFPIAETQEGQGVTRPIRVVGANQPSMAASGSFPSGSAPNDLSIIDVTASKGVSRPASDPAISMTRAAPDRARNAAASVDFRRRARP